MPKGAITARHSDSHDTFWGPLPGFKWRREQYGLPATRALLATWSMIGGVYMMFVGGEFAVEDDIRRMNRLRHELTEIRIGSAEYDHVSVEDDRIFTVVRIHEGAVSLVLVNLSNQTIATHAMLDASLLPSASSCFQIHDVWNDVAIAGQSGYAWTAGELASFSLSFAPFQPRVLTIRPVATEMRAECEVPEVADLPDTAR
ncbi:MAG: hypothetical protein ACR2OU_18995 [Thermomicrobiales bacterium]